MKKDCHEQVKTALRKFQSSDRLSEDKDTERMQFKEGSFVAEVKEALLADGWQPPPCSKFADVQ